MFRAAAITVAAVAPVAAVGIQGSGTALMANAGTVAAAAEILSVSAVAAVVAVRRVNYFSQNHIMNWQLRLNAQQLGPLDFHQKEIQIKLMCVPISVYARCRTVERKN